MDQNYGISLKKLVEDTGLQVVNRSSDYDKLKISTQVLNRSGLQLTGFYDYFDNDRIQLIGLIETAYLEQFPANIRKEKFEQLMASGIPALIICHDAELMPECLEAAREYDVTLLKTQRETSELMVSMITQLQQGLAPRVTQHGVLVEVYGEGLLLQGESGIGKSEAAIELIKRGHRLIADDAVEIKRVDSNTLTGTAPDLIRYYIELRGIGVIDVRNTFGGGAVKLSEKIDLVVKLETWKEGAVYDRIGAQSHYMDILGVQVPYITVPITPGRNLAVILEVAAMNNKQKKMGYDSAKAFTSQLDKYFDEHSGLED